MPQLVLTVYICAHWTALVGPAKHTAGLRGRTGGRRLPQDGVAVVALGVLGVQRVRAARCKQACGVRLICALTKQAVDVSAGARALNLNA